MHWKQSWNCTCLANKYHTLGEWLTFVKDGWKTMHLNSGSVWPPFIYLLLHQMVGTKMNTRTHLVRDGLTSSIFRVQTEDSSIAVKV